MTPIINSSTTVCKSNTNEHFLAIGKNLKAFREQQQKSFEQLESDTGLCPYQIKTLEAGDFEKFRAPTYTRGYIKKYCEALGICAVEMLEMYQTGIKLEEHATKSDDIRLMSGSHLRVFKMGEFKNLITIKRFKRLFSSRKLSSSEFSSRAISSGLISTVTCASLAAIVMLVSPVQSLIISDEELALTSNDSELSNVSDRQLLELNPLMTGWVEVVDAKGNILLADIIPEGQLEIVQGTPPFSISLNGGQLEAKYLDKSIHLSSDSGDNTTRFMVGN